MLIDDDRAWLEAVAGFLRGKRLEVYTASDAASGFTLLELIRPHVVLFDGHLPDMEGLEFLRRLRARRPNLTTLIVSADDQAKAALSARARAFVCKSASPLVVLRTIELSLNADSARTQNDAYRQGTPCLTVLISSPTYLPVPFASSRIPFRNN